MEKKAVELQAYIELIVHRLMIVQNGFLQTSAAGLSMTELKVIAFIGKQKSCIMREIADYLLITKNNLTAIMDKLVRKDLVQRERSETDRRVVNVSLSKKGQQIFTQESATHLALSKGMLNALDGAEQAQLLRILKKITA